ncbi:hypothetical protein ABT160_29780 [Streptomyces sp. NPDC001941]|uniref:hypothetical protein n=1 Tax=Streptomyces sp. NPDC001941 TaxID=3154659 RepID=UPI00331DCC42
MHNAADPFLAALEPLPFAARLRHTALTAHRLAAENALAPLLADLDARGTYERRLAALAALVGRDGVHLGARIADPDPVVSGYALRGVRELGLPDADVEAAYEDAPSALRRRLARVLADGACTVLAERLVGRLRREWGDAEAARLLPACSGDFVARELPGLAHAVEDWPRIGRRHPEAVVAHAAVALAEAPDDGARTSWWARNATLIAGIAHRLPEAVMELLDRFGPPRLPAGLYGGLGALVKADAERLVRWLCAPEREQGRHAQILPPGVLRALVRAEPPSLPDLGVTWANWDVQLAPLVEAMPPARRVAYLTEVVARGTSRDPFAAVYESLPRESRWDWVRRAVAEESDDALDWYHDLSVLAHGSFAEARGRLYEGIARSDADDRGYAWRQLVACVARDGSPEAGDELLGLVGRLRNDRDTVRAQALGAMADSRPGLFRAGGGGAADAPVAEVLDALAAGVLDARDCSAATRLALRRLAERVLIDHAGAEAPAGTRTDSTAAPLAQWALRTLGRITGRVGVPDFGPLHRVLPQGQEYQVLRALKPWLDAAAARSDFRLLLGLTRALGARADRMSELQDMLVTALDRGDDAAFEEAAELWLAAPATRDARVARILEREPSAAVLAPVRDVLARRRTDLLDVLLAASPPYGRFLVEGARRPLPDFAHSARWLPRQQRAAARLAAEAAADTGLPLDERAAVIREAAAVPDYGHALALAFKDDGSTVVAEAALAALSRTDRPQEAVPVLLAEAGGDRARVAVYAASRAASSTAPSRLGTALGALLTDTTPVKVTSRKEAVRLAARYLPRGRAAALLNGAFHAPDAHPDVRLAVIEAALPLLEEPAILRLFEEAARGTDRPTLRAVLCTDPARMAAAQRTRFARVVADGYPRWASRDDGVFVYAAYHGLRAWFPYGPELVSRMADVVCVPEAHDHWSNAASAIRDLGVSGLPHPLGGTLPGSAYHSTLTRLLAASHDYDPLHETGTDQDLPALQRLRTLVEVTWSGRGSGALVETATEAVARLLADEPLLATERAGLLHSLLVRNTVGTRFAHCLGDFADALEAAGVVVAARLTRDMPRQWEPWHVLFGTGDVRDAVERQIDDGTLVRGLLATGVVAAAGGFLEWPEEWRALLRRLRGHGCPEVRAEARTVLTATG